MKIHRKIFPSSGVALTIGNFDGVHRGHQKLLQQLQNSGFDSVLMSFYPHPQAFITGKSPLQITTFSDRAHWLKHYGLQNWIIIHFNQQFMQLSPEKFVELYLLPLKVKKLFVGEDFRFGFRGQGNVDFLRTIPNFTTEVLSDIHIDGTRISSSTIREALTDHDVDLAQALLGHDLTFSGFVRPGAGRGKHLDAATANLHVSEHFAAPDGVYVVQVDDFWGVANLGKAPTFNGLQRKLEIHLFTENLNLYGKRLTVRLKKFLRSEKKFPNTEKLKQQIQIDIEQSHEFIKTFRL